MLSKTSASYCYTMHNWNSVLSSASIERWRISRNELVRNLWSVLFFGSAESCEVFHIEKLSVCRSCVIIGEKLRASPKKKLKRRRDVFAFFSIFVLLPPVRRSASCAWGQCYEIDEERNKQQKLVFSDVSAYVRALGKRSHNIYYDEFGFFPVSFGVGVVCVCFCSYARIILCVLARAPGRTGRVGGAPCETLARTLSSIVKVTLARSSFPESSSSPPPTGRVKRRFLRRARA